MFRLPPLEASPSTDGKEEGEGRGKAFGKTVQSSEFRVQSLEFGEVGRRTAEMHECENQELGTWNPELASVVMKEAKRD